MTRTANEARTLYSQVHALLRTAISSGELGAGGALPSEKDLGIKYGVSRITVRRALEELQREGMVVRGKGRQARVTEPLVSTARTSIEDDFASMLDLVRGTESRVVVYKWRLADEMIRSKLCVPDDEPVLQVDRIRSNGGTAMLHTRAHVPAWIGARLEADMLVEQTMLNLLIRSGVSIADAAQEMHAAPCPSEIAQLIGLSAGDPVFVIERLVRDSQGRAVQHLVATFRWDCYTYRVSSTKTSAERVVEIAGAGHLGPPSSSLLPLSMATLLCAPKGFP